MKFMAICKKLIYWLLAVVALFACVFYLSLNLINLDYYKEQFENGFLQYTGRPLHIQGKIKLIFNGDLTILAEDVTIDDEPWGKFSELAHIKRVELQLSLLSLLQREVRIENIEASGVKLWLETDKSGKGNWEFLLYGKDQSTTVKDFILPPVDSLLIDDLDLTYYNGEMDVETKLTFAKMNLEINEPFHALHLESKGQYSDSAVSLEAKGRLVDGKTPKHIFLDMKGNIGEINLLVKGTIAKPSTDRWLDLQINANGLSTKDFHSLFGLQLKPVEHFILNTHLEAHSAVLVFDTIKARVGETKLNGQVKINGMVSPAITHLRLHLKAYNAGDFLKNMGITNLFRDGRLYLTLTATTQGKRQDDVLQNLKGALEFIIENTSFDERKLQRIDHEFTKELGNPKNSLIPVEIFDGRITLTQGKAKFNQSLLEGKHFLYRISGDLDFMNNNIDVYLKAPKDIASKQQKQLLWHITGKLNQPLVDELPAKK